MSDQEHFVPISAYVADDEDADALQEHMSVLVERDGVTGIVPAKNLKKGDIVLQLRPAKRKPSQA